MSPLHKRANSSLTSPRVNVEMAAMMHQTSDHDEDERDGRSPLSASTLGSAMYENGEGRLGRRSVDGDRFGSERESLDSEEDRAALLGESLAGPSRRRPTEDTWTQVKEIALEVRLSQPLVALLADADGHEDSADTSVDHRGPALHWRATGPRLRKSQTSAELYSITERRFVALGSNEED